MPRTHHRLHWRSPEMSKRKKQKLISVRQAAVAGIERLRMPRWASPLDHLKIDIIDGAPGPWVHLYCPQNKSINGRDPVDILAIRGINKISHDPDAVEFVPYDGPDHTSPEYTAAAARFAEQAAGVEVEEQATHHPQ